ncbi:hypothetical protein [Pseudomonas sp. RGB]|nr:hypothetical protein [Pseudomonas sp. RGB]
MPERYTAHQRDGLYSVALPLTLASFTVAMLCTRGCLREVCGQ